MIKELLVEDNYKGLDYNTVVKQISNVRTSNPGMPYWLKLVYMNINGLLVSSRSRRSLLEALRERFWGWLGGIVWGCGWKIRFGFFREGSGIRILRCQPKGGLQISWEVFWFIFEFLRFSSVSCIQYISSWPISRCPLVSKAFHWSILNLSQLQWSASLGFRLT